MTREDAYKKISESQAGKKISAYDVAPSVFCDYLELIGLMKFDDPYSGGYVTDMMGHVKEAIGAESPRRILNLFDEAIRAIENMDEAKKVLSGLAEWIAYAVGGKKA